MSRSFATTPIATRMLSPIPRMRRSSPAATGVEFRMALPPDERPGKARQAPKRNGGRHRCQPPLRRAKDLPVFATWSIEPFGQSTRSRSWLTSSGVAFHRTAPSCEEPDRSTRLRGPKVRWSFDLSGPASGTEVPRSQNRPVFCGPSWVDHSCVPLRSPKIRRSSGAASRLRKIDSSGASSRLAR